MSGNGQNDQAVQGAMGGAMTGAGAGSAAGPWGALIGGVAGGALGGIAGYMGGDEKTAYQAQLKALAMGYGERGAPQLGPASLANYSQFRSNQAGLIAQLEAMARGEGPSAATVQMREAMDRAAASQASAAAGAGGRGVNAGAALRNANNNTMAVQSQGARDTAALRAQEQANAMGMLGTAISQGRAADEGINQFNAGQNNQFGIANLDANMKALGINTSAQLQALQAALGLASPGTGTSIMAGGASAMPGLMQYGMAQQQQQNMLAQQQSQQNQLANQYNTGPVTNPGGSSMFGAYGRDDT